MTDRAQDEPAAAEFKLKTGWKFWLGIIAFYAALKFGAAAGAMAGAIAVAGGWYCAQEVRRGSRNPWHIIGLATAVLVVLVLVVLNMAAAVRVDRWYGTGVASLEQCTTAYAVPAQTAEGAAHALHLCRKIDAGEAYEAEKCQLPMIRDANSKPGLHIAVAQCAREHQAPPGPSKHVSRAEAPNPFLDPAPARTQPAAAAVAESAADADFEAEWHRQAVAWERANPGFMAAGGRSDAMQAAILQVEQESGGQLTPQALLQRAEGLAFEQTGWADELARREARCSASYAATVRAMDGLPMEQFVPRHDEAIAAKSRCNQSAR